MGKPTYQELFGSADYYSVSPERSVLSPAAYLVALMRLVKSHITENDSSKSLKVRRPDIWSITLDAENTDTLIPKLEIANQVLSVYLEGQNTLESSDVLAYQAIRRYLAQSGTSLPQIWQQLTPNPDSATRHAIARETLQFSPQQWSQLKTKRSDLALALNWAPDELSLALQTLGLDATPVDDSALPPLAWIQTQISANGYSIAQACACLGAPPATVTNAFLDRIATDLAGNASWSVPPAGTTGFSSDHAIINALTSALQVGQDDLLAIARLANQGAASLQLGASGIAVLYRLSQLPRSTGLTIRDSLLAAALADVDTSALTGSDCTQALQAITQLTDFCAWLKKSPLSLHQLQFILTGSSDNRAIQNKILGEDAVRNFLREIERLRSQVHPSQQRQFFVDHLAALYGVPHQIGAVLADWADMNIANIVAGGATSAGSLSDALPLNDPSAAATVLHKLQQAAELITALSLSPSEARYFKCAYQPTARYPISLEAIKTEVLFRDLVRSFQDSQNHFLDILQGPSLRYLTAYTPSGSTAATYYAVATNLPYPSNLPQPWTGTTGGDWGPPTTGIPGDAHITCLAQLGDALFAGTQSGLYYLNGNDWQQVTPAAQNGLPGNAVITCLAQLGNASCTGTQSGLYYQNENYEWQQVTPAAQDGLSGDAVISCLYGDFVGTQSGLYCLSIVNGNIESYLVTPVAQDGLPANAVITCLYGDFVGTQSGLYCLSTVNGNIESCQVTPATQDELPADAVITCMAQLGSTSYAGTQSGLYYLNGNVWQQVTPAAQNGLPASAVVTCMAQLGSTSYAGTQSGLYYENENSHWQLVGNGAPADANITFVSECNSIPVIGTSRQMYALFSENWVPIHFLDLRKLATLTGWQWELISQTSQAVAGLDSIAQVALYQQYFETAGRLSITGDLLQRLLQLAAPAGSSSSGTDASSLSKALYGGLQANYRGQLPVLAQISASAEVARRDWLVNSFKTQGLFSNARELFEYFLIDVEVDGSIQTSKIREATGAVQLYIYRCLNQLESTVTVEHGLAQRWGWMYAYREWQANMEVFLYPEDYIQPELRKDKTDLFSKLESDLKQANLANPDSVEVAFRDYMNGLAEIASLEIVGSAIRHFIRDGAVTKTLCLVGKTSQQPERYFYRLATFVDDQPSDWGQWRKINIQIHPVRFQENGAGPELTGAITPTFAFGTWHLFWVEQKQSGSTPTGSTSNPTPQYTLSAHCTLLDFNGRWRAAQQIGCIDALENPVTTHTDSKVNLVPSIDTPEGFSSRGLMALCGFNGSLYACDGNGLWSSPDGSTWSQLQQPAASPSIQLNSIQTLGSFNGSLYACDGNGLWNSPDGATWSSIQQSAASPSIQLNSIQTLGSFNGSLYAYDGNGLWSSSDGATWSSIQQSTASSSIQLNSIKTFGNFNGSLYACDKNGLWSSSDGATWSSIQQSTASSSIQLNSIQTLGSFNGSLYACDRNGLWSSPDGATWSSIQQSEASPSIELGSIKTLGSFNGSLYACDINGLWSSPDGDDWYWFVANFNWLFTSLNGTYYAFHPSTSKIYHSISGLFFSSNPIQSTTDTSIPLNRVQAFCGFNGNLYACDGNGLWNSPDGATWSSVQQSAASPSIQLNSIQALGSFNSSLYACDGNGLWNSSDGAAWSQIQQPQQLAANPSIQLNRIQYLFCFNGDLYAYDGAYLWVSQDVEDWDPVAYSRWIGAHSYINFNSNLYGLSDHLYQIHYGQKLEVIVLSTNSFLVDGDVNLWAPNESVRYLTIGNNSGEESISLGTGENSESIFYLNSPRLRKISVQLYQPNGIEALLATTTQMRLDNMDFTSRNAVSVYLWEMFFHAPFLIARELHTQQHFKSARTWYERIFDPSLNQRHDSLLFAGETRTDLYWRFLGLRSAYNSALRNDGANSTTGELWSALNNPVERRELSIDPFDPQAIAKLRPIAYQKTIVTHYIENLLAWGDALFRENTRESIGEAEMFYVMAYDLLGTEPKKLGGEPPSYEGKLLNVRCLVVGDTHQYAGTDQGLYYRQLDGDWTLLTTTVPQDANVQCLAYSTTNMVYVGTSSGLWVGTGGNSGQWVQATFPGSTPDVQCLSEFQGQMLAGTSSGLYYANDAISGSDTSCNYVAVGRASQNPIPSSANIQCLVAGKWRQYAGTNQGLYYRQTDGGNWTLLTNSVPQDANVQCLAYSTSGLVYVSTSSGLWIGSDGDKGTWTQATFPVFGLVIQCFSEFNGQMFAGTQRGLYLEEDSSTHNFIAVGPASQNGIPPTANIQCLVAGQQHQYAGTDQGLYYRQTDGNWTLLTEVPKDINVQCMACTSSTSTSLEIVYVGLATGICAGWGGREGTWTLELGLFGIPQDRQSITLERAELSECFDVPPNRQFLAYWDKVRQRLHNIRNGLTIDGKTDVLPLFQPPINPMQLVEAVAAGIGVAQSIESLDCAPPYYRFEVMVEKAKAAAQNAISLGQSLLSALEQKDAQKLAVLYNTNQRHILRLSRTSGEDQLNAAGQNVLALQAGLASAQGRQTYYNQLIKAGLSAGEIVEVALTAAGLDIQVGADALQIAAIIGYLVPNIYGLADGGMQFGNAILQGANVLESAGSQLAQAGSLAGNIASFQRRAQEWQLQAALAQDEVTQINYQIVAAEYQQHLAQQGITLLDANIDREESVARFYLSKFTNEQLYHWYIGKVSSLYFQAYQLAHDLALQAEHAWKYEQMGRGSASADKRFVVPGNWNSLYQGLLAGESLQLDLQRMEKAYLDQNQRRLEITKTISLARLKPEAFLLLKTTGTCDFHITEQDFDGDYPGHYCRLIKSISVSLPLVLGPYQDIHATLTQTGSKVVISDGPDGQAAAAYLLSPSNALGSGAASLMSDMRPNQQIALSQGINDSGLFELNFNDERYLPFEGTGAVSHWKLEIPKESNPASFESLSDVIIQLRYTALVGNASFKTAVQNALAPLVH